MVGCFCVFLYSIGNDDDDDGERTDRLFLLGRKSNTRMSIHTILSHSHTLHPSFIHSFNQSIITPQQQHNQQNEQKDLAKNPIDLVSVGLVDDSNLYEWEILIMGPDGTLYEGGFFKAKLTFPPDFPNMPPTMTFLSEMWHPNVYEDGRVCISILHPPGEDQFNSQESADERWRPILGVEQILISVISMLSDPNDESPANLDAAVMWRKDRPAFKKKVKQVVRKSQDMC